MKLFYSATSPFVRRCLVCAIEAGLDDQIERIVTNPGSPDSDIMKNNPLGKVPALTIDEGATLCDSIVICLYLDSLSPRTSLVPSEGPARWNVLNIAALCEGVMDAGVSRVGENRARPEHLRWSGWHERQRGKIEAVCDAMEREAAARQLEGVDLGTITLGCALGYLDLRFADEPWREGRPALTAWYETFAARPSMQATVPPGA